MATVNSTSTSSSTSTEDSESYRESLEEFSDDEGIENYKLGGYHFVSIGDTFKNGRYVVQSKLGWGHFSTVWLTWDTKENKYVALKVQKSAPNYIEAAKDEISILNQIRDGDPDDEKCIVTLLDHFKHRGPNGQHFCMVFEYLGDDLLSLIKYYNHKGMPLKMLKKICYYILIGLDYLHRQLFIIHTDLKPENILLVSAIDSSKDPRKNGKPLILPPQETNKTELPLNSALPKKPLNSAALNETDPPSNCADPKEPLISATPKAMASTSAVGLTKNQKSKLRKKSRELALDNSKKGSVIEVPADSGVKKEDSVQKVLSLKVENVEKAKKEDNVQNVVPLKVENVKEVAPLKKMKLSDRRKILASIDLRCKIVDFGNSCWTYKQFTDVIQTRQFRAPEVIIGAGYSTPADMWSFACIAFELATGEVPFDPHSGDGFSRDEDHLAAMMELIGVFPKEIALSGRYSHKFFDRAGHLKNIRPSCFRPLDRLLIKRYHMNEQEANEFADFLGPLLNFDPEKRPTASECLIHPWLNGAPFAPEPYAQDQNEKYVHSPEISEQVSNEKQPALVKKDNTDEVTGLKGEVYLAVEGFKSDGTVQANALQDNSIIGGFPQVNEALGKLTITGSQSDQDVQAVKDTYESP